MNKKLIYIIILVFGIVILNHYNLIAQTEITSITYTYDAAGNRQTRTISVKKINEKDSLNLLGNVGDNINESLQTNNATELIDQLGNKEITIYPNPTEGLLKVNITNLENSKGYIKLYGVNGSEVLKINTLKESNEVDISDKVNGVYVMEVWVEGEKRAYKVVKR